jgi:Tol biopolymer transport system component
LSSILTRRAVLRAAAVAAAAPAVAPLVMGGESPYATAPGAPGSITYKVGNIVYIANADGSNPRVLTDNIGDDGDWSPDGSRWVYARSGLQSIRSDGTREMVILASLAQNPTYTEDGRYVLFSYNGELQVVEAGGDWSASVPLLDIPADALYRDRPAVSSDGTIIFEQGDAQVYDARTIVRADSDVDLTPLIDNAWDADFSPNGAQIVFVRSQQAAQRFQIWIADADGTNQVQITTDAANGTWN